jgi:hypothetical protein
MTPPSRVLAFEKKRETIRHIASRMNAALLGIRTRSVSEWSHMQQQAVEAAPQTSESGHFRPQQPGTLMSAVGAKADVIVCNLVRPAHPEVPGDPAQGAR